MIELGEGDDFVASSGREVVVDFGAAGNKDDKP